MLMGLLLALGLTVSPMFSHAPAELRFKIVIEPDAANRAFALTLDGERYYRSTAGELNGEDDVKTRWIVYGSVPAGRYIATLVVEKVDGTFRRTSVEGIRVLGWGDRPDGVERATNLQADP